MGKNNIKSKKNKKTKSRFGALGGIGLGMLAGIQPFYDISQLPQEETIIKVDKNISKGKKPIKRDLSHLLALQEKTDRSLRGIFQRLYH